jgi:hypothetical protein
MSKSFPYPADVEIMSISGATIIVAARRFSIRNGFGLHRIAASASVCDAGLRGFAEKAEKACNKTAFLASYIGRLGIVGDRAIRVDSVEERR